jgi:hypothetical protein
MWLGQHSWVIFPRDNQKKHKNVNVDDLIEIDLITTNPIYVKKVDEKT